MFKTFVFTVVLIFTIFLLTSCPNGSNKDKPVVFYADLSEHSLYKTYDFGSTDKIIDIGIQPLSIPPGIIGELLGKDTILMEALADLGYELRIHPFYKSADSNYFLQSGELELATGGDMPAIMASVSMNIVITSLVKYGYSSIISEEFMLISEFKNKKIAYPEISNAHFSLLEALNNSGLNEDDLELIPMKITDMADALNKGEIDAFTAWEPNSSMSLKKFNNFLVIHKSVNTSYLYFKEEFFTNHFEAAKLIIASQIRSIWWLKRSLDNRYKAAGWAESSRLSLIEDTVNLTPSFINTILERDLLRVSSSGALPSSELDPTGRIFREFSFLRQNGIVPVDTDWERVRSSFNGSIHEEILNKSNEYKLNVQKYLDNL